MLKTTEMILDSGLANHAFKDTALANLFGGTPARRYGLVNRALKSGELIQLSRGLYTIAPKYQKEYFSLYYLANQIVPLSYVTCESALQYHQWIPERVNTITSLSNSGRNKEFNTKYGLFVYKIHPIKDGMFLTGVNLENINQKNVFIASPLRALMDYVYLYKIENADFDFLHTSLRIEKDSLTTIKKSEIISFMS